MRELLIDKETGSTFVEGDVIRMPVLADTLETIANDPLGINEFYNGSIGAKIVNDVQEGGKYHHYRNKRPGCLISRSNKKHPKTHQTPSVLCTPSFEKSPIKTQRWNSVHLDIIKLPVPLIGKKSMSQRLIWRGFRYHVFGLFFRWYSSDDRSSELSSPHWISDFHEIRPKSYSLWPASAQRKCSVALHAEYSRG